MLSIIITEKYYLHQSTSLSSENLEDIRPCFGRGDDEYVKIENSVLKRIKIFQVIEKLSDYKVPQVLLWRF